MARFKTHSCAFSIEIWQVVYIYRLCAGCCFVPQCRVRANTAQLVVIRSLLAHRPPEELGCMSLAYWDQFETSLERRVTTYLLCMSSSACIFCLKCISYRSHVTADGLEMREHPYTELTFLPNTHVTCHISIGHLKCMPGMIDILYRYHSSSPLRCQSVSPIGLLLDPAAP